jgi:hypothetical protein
LVQSTTVAHFLIFGQGHYRTSPRSCIIFFHNARLQLITCTAKAKVVLLNPNPALGHWGSPSFLPNFDTLADLADFQRLKEFGGIWSFLDQIIWDCSQAFIGRPRNTALERLTFNTLWEWSLPALPLIKGFALRIIANSRMKLYLH